MAKKKSSGSDRSRIYRYYRSLQLPGVTKEKAKELAGYSKNYPSANIEKTAAFKQIEKEVGAVDNDMSSQVRDTIKRTGATVGYMTDTVLEILEDPSVDARDKATFLKELRTITGQQAPTQESLHVSADEELLKSLRKKKDD